MRERAPLCEAFSLLLFIYRGLPTCPVPAGSFVNNIYISDACQPPAARGDESSHTAHGARAFLAPPLNKIKKLAEKRANLLLYFWLNYLNYLMVSKDRRL